MSDHAPDRALVEVIKDKVRIPQAWHALGLGGEPATSCRAPWREDHKPSFSVYDDGKAWKDHSTDEQGDIFAFVTRATGWPFKEVLDWLANLAGLSREDFSTSPLSHKHNQEWAKKKRQRQRIAHEQATINSNAKLITAHLQSTLEVKLAPYRSDEDWRYKLWESSPMRLEAPADDPRHFISQLFKPDDLLWLGETYESGSDRHRENFRPRIEWEKLYLLPPRIAAGIFNAGSISRGLDSIQAAPFIVLESDDLIGREPVTPVEKELNKTMSYALFRYAQDRLGLTPRAVIDTGNKSLHLFFDRPPPDDLAALLRLADGLRIDRGLLEKCAAAPLRMPNCIHEKTDKPARLLYLNPIF